jgi:endonuclease III
MGTLRKIKRGQVKPSPLDPRIMEAWNGGFKQGVKEQRESDIENLVNLLEGLEDIPGIGEKTATKLRMFFLDKFNG